MRHSLTTKPRLAHDLIYRLAVSTSASAVVWQDYRNVSPCLTLQFYRFLYCLWILVTIVLLRSLALKSNSLSTTHSTKAGEVHWWKSKRQDTLLQLLHTCKHPHPTATQRQREALQIWGWLGPHSETLSQNTHGKVLVVCFSVRHILMVNNQLILQLEYLILSTLILPAFPAWFIYCFKMTYLEPTFVTFSMLVMFIDLGINNLLKTVLGYSY